jgi:hypothetical protein
MAKNIKVRELRRSLLAGRQADITKFIPNILGASQHFGTSHCPG